MTDYFLCGLSPITDREHFKTLNLKEDNKWQSGSIFNTRANSSAESSVSKMKAKQEAVR